MLPSSVPWWQAKPTPRVSWSVTLVMAGTWAFLRLAIFRDFVFPLTYVLPLLVCVWTRDKVALWVMAAAFALMHTAQQAWVLPAAALSTYADWATYVATLINISVGAAAVHLIIVLRDRLESSMERIEAQNEELARQNDELAQQAEELSSQAEELSQQAEELSQQAEEMQQQVEQASQQNEELQARAREINALGADLTNREALLETLFDTARVGGAEEGALREICAAALRMFGEPVGLAAVYERHDSRLVTRSAAAVPPGDRMVPASIAANSTFAAIVIDENRTAGLDDASQRPDLQLVQVQGVPPFRAVLGSPLRAGGQAFGAFMIYSSAPQRWTDQQFHLVEWLARQASGILQLLRLQEMLRDADRRKSEFLATLSHELRNPLAPIRYALEALKRQQEGEAAAAMEVIERQLAHLVRLVDDLLDLNRISSNRIRLRRSRVELATVIRSAVEAALPEITRAQHELRVDVPPGIFWLDADAHRLAQVFTNLLLNAARYTPPSGWIAVAASPDGDGALVVSVRDNGSGLRAEDLGRVFEMFAQVGEPSHGGLGIGLALVKGLVELHGGSVAARSDGPGQGSEFRVRLPLAAEPRAAAPQESAPALAAERRRILVVDDNADSADMLRMLLDLRGHDVRVAYDGYTALRLLPEFQPDIGLFDIGLPGLTGYELARRVRQEAEGERMFLVAITGWGQEEDRQRARDSGFDAHVTKPADPDRLDHLIASMSRQAAAPR